MYMTERFSVMIVDDEENVRNLLKNCIDWSSLGICIAAEAGTAEEAFEKLTHMAPPTIICADI
jgi:two-component system response regulator YesN